MIKMTEYAKRRSELMRKIGPQGIMILPSSPEVLRNGDATYSYRQHSDFYYLTGLEEPDAVMVLAPKRQEGEYILFNRSRDPDREIWDGPRAGQEGARKLYKADQAFVFNELPHMLPELLEGRDTIHYPLGIHTEFDKLILSGLGKVRSRIRGGAKMPDSFADITPTLHEMRVIKSKEEIDVIQKAVDISADAHIRAMSVCRPGMYEYELEAELMHEFVRNGARSPAYNSIVGAGRNSCVLHYINNNAKIKSGDLVLIDAGAEYQNYAADITRTFPANGKFSGEQRAIYEIVLDAQLAAIKTVKPGSPWTAAQDAIIKTITQGLVDLKLLKGDVSNLIEKKAYKTFYMHNSGHWLGLDVHDVGMYRLGGKWRTLKEGMVLTIEPGIYISDSMSKVDKRWHNIGVRIEDDLVVTKKGHHVLSHKVPKTIEDVEAAMV